MTRVQVFPSSEQAIHVWAQRNQDTGRCNNAFWESRDVIYSYGRHFPLAAFLDREILNLGIPNNQETGHNTATRQALEAANTIVVVNLEHYSPTTAGHQRKVIDATNHYPQIHVDTCTLQALVSWKEGRVPTLDTVKQYAETMLKICFVAQVVKASKRKKVALIVEDIDVVTNMQNHVTSLFQILGLQVDAIITGAIKDFKDNYRHTIATYQEQVKKDTAAKVERERLQNIAIAEKVKIAVPLWIDGKRNFSWEGYNIDIDLLLRANCKDIYLRIRPGVQDVVQTSHGAEFPLADAKNVFTAIVRWKNEGAEYCRNGHKASLRLGNFMVDKVHLNGDVQAGCHFVKWAQIEELAKQLNLITGE